MPKREDNRSLTVAVKGRGSDDAWRLMAVISMRCNRWEMPSGALTLLILRVLRSGSLHGYAIAQRIHSLSSEVLQVEEGALYPALQKILLKGGRPRSGASPKPIARFAFTA